MFELDLELGLVDRLLHLVTVGEGTPHVAGRLLPLLRGEIKIGIAENGVIHVLRGNARSRRHLHHLRDAIGMMKTVGGIEGVEPEDHHLHHLGHLLHLHLLDTITITEIARLSLLTALKTETETETEIGTETGYHHRDKIPRLHLVEGNVHPSEGNQGTITVTEAVEGDPLLRDALFRRYLLLFLHPHHRGMGGGVLRGMGDAGALRGLLRLLGAIGIEIGIGTGIGI